jgi:hypothetical protein
MGRLFWASVLFAIGVAIAFFLTRRPKPAEPATWAATIVGAVLVWGMFALAYGVIPHEWLTFASSYLNWSKDTWLLKENQWAEHLPPFGISRQVVADSIAAGMYVVFAVLNVYLFSAWQKRPAASEAAAPAEGEVAEEPTGPLARLRRRARVSAYGRPVTTAE